jgi:glucan 1,3-beta-glucosidase
VFDVNALRQSPDSLVETTCNFGNNEVARGDKWTFTGEWSGAMTDCAKYLNGRGVGTRWEGTHPSQKEVLGSCAGKSVGSMAGLSQADRDNTRKFIEAQLNAFEKGVGWFFWTW